MSLQRQFISATELFYRNAYNLLLQRVPEHSAVEPAKLSHKDFPLIDYWFKQQWVSSSGNRVADLVEKPENENENENEKEKNEN